jgi:hypothetical protein
MAAQGLLKNKGLILKTFWLYNLAKSLFNGEVLQT